MVICVALAPLVFALGLLPFIRWRIHAGVERREYPGVDDHSGRYFLRGGQPASEQIREIFKQFPEVVSVASQRARPYESTDGAEHGGCAGSESRAGMVSCTLFWIACEEFNVTPDVRLIIE
jgi:hypothetical protein